MRRPFFIFALSITTGLTACGGDNFSNNPASSAGGASGAGGSGGSGGSGGTAGTAGMAAGGKAGQGGEAGQGGAGGAAVGQPCTAGTFACVGNALLACEASTLTYAAIDACGDSKFCDAAAGECKACKPGAITGCASENTQAICSDGASKKEQACPSTTPFCTGAGECVECAEDSHCKLPSDEANECFVSACISGVCSKKPAAAGAKSAVSPASGCEEHICDGTGKFESKPFPKGQSCPGGVCSGTGVCGECLPGATECKGSASLSTCSDKGSWQPAVACQGKPACSQGACQGVLQVVTGSGFSCARLEDKTVRCWGAVLSTPVNDWGPKFGEVEHLVAIRNHVCALDKAGQVFCMGNNQYGQFGNNKKSSQSEVIDTPSKVETSLAFEQIVTGFTFACGVEATSKDILCWGNNSFQQLGLPAGTLSENLVPLKFQAISPFKSGDVLALGDNHGCLLRESKLRCWGHNNKGQVGKGTTTFSGEPPTEVTNLPGIPVAIAAAANTQIAMVQSGDQIKMVRWGEFPYEDTTPSAQPTSTGKLGPYPLLMPGETVLAWTEGTSKTLFVQGRNFAAQLGNGKQEQTFGFAQHDEAPWDGVSSSKTHICAWEKGGEAWCWGANESQQTGIPEPKTYITSPTKVQW